MGAATGQGRWLRRCIVWAACAHAALATVIHLPGGTTFVIHDYAVSRCWVEVEALAVHDGATWGGGIAYRGNQGTAVDANVSTVPANAGVYVSIKKKKVGDFHSVYVDLIFAPNLTAPRTVTIAATFTPGGVKSNYVRQCSIDLQTLKTFSLNEHFDGQDGEWLGGGTVANGVLSVHSATGPSVHPLGDGSVRPEEAYFALATREPKEGATVRFQMHRTPCELGVSLYENAAMIWGGGGKRRWQEPPVALSRSIVSGDFIHVAMALDWDADTVDFKFTHFLKVRGAAKIQEHHIADAQLRGACLAGFDSVEFSGNGMLEYIMVGGHAGRNTTLTDPDYLSRPPGAWQPHRPHKAAPAFTRTCDSYVVVNHSHHAFHCLEYIFGEVDGEPALQFRVRLRDSDGWGALGLGPADRPAGGMVGLGIIAFNASGVMDYLPVAAAAPHRLDRAPAAETHWVESFWEGDFKEVVFYRKLHSGAGFTVTDGGALSLGTAAGLGAAMERHTRTHAAEVVLRRQYCLLPTPAPPVLPSPAPHTLVPPSPPSPVPPTPMPPTLAPQTSAPPSPAPPSPVPQTSVPPSPAPPSPVPPSSAPPSPVLPTPMPPTLAPQTSAPPSGQAPSPAPPSPAAETLTAAPRTAEPIPEPTPVTPDPNAVPAPAPSTGPAAEETASTPHPAPTPASVPPPPPTASASTAPQSIPRFPPTSEPVKQEAVDGAPPLDGGEGGMGASTWLVVAAGAAACCAACGLAMRRRYVRREAETLAQGLCAGGLLMVEAEEMDGAGFDEEPPVHEAVSLTRPGSSARLLTRHSTLDSAGSGSPKSGPYSSRSRASPRHADWRRCGRGTPSARRASIASPRARPPRTRSFLTRGARSSIDALDGNAPPPLT